MISKCTAKLILDWLNIDARRDCYLQHTVERAIKDDLIDLSLNQLEYERYVCAWDKVLNFYEDMALMNTVGPDKESRLDQVEEDIAWKASLSIDARAFAIRNIVLKEDATEETMKEFNRIFWEDC